MRTHATIALLVLLALPPGSAISDEGRMLADELAKAHIIVTTALIPCRPAPVLVTEEVVKRMREGSVIVDLAAATGGNCPLTEKDQVVVKHGVTLVGYTNFPALVPSDASAFYAGNLKNLLDIMVEQGEQGLALKPFADDEITPAAESSTVIVSVSKWLFASDRMILPSSVPVGSKVYCAPPESVAPGVKVWSASTTAQLP